jgi:hypothetical protein
MPLTLVEIWLGATTAPAAQWQRVERTPGELGQDAKRRGAISRPISRRALFVRERL